MCECRGDLQVLGEMCKPKYQGNSVSTTTLHKQWRILKGLRAPPSHPAAILFGSDGILNFKPQYFLAPPAQTRKPVTFSASYEYCFLLFSFFVCTILLFYTKNRP